MIGRSDAHRSCKKKKTQLEAKCHVADDHRMMWRAMITRILKKHSTEKKNVELFNKRFMDFLSSLLKMGFYYEEKKRMTCWYTQQVILQIIFYWPTEEGI